MGTLPSVSVCIPAHGSDTRLSGALRSVLAQTYPHLEVVVLDNACGHGVPELVAEFADDRVRMERSEQVLPLAESWNRLLEVATGDLVKLVCPDDLVHPDIVARQAALFVDDPGLAVVSCRRHLVSENGRVLAVERGLGGLLGRHGGRDAVRKVVRRGGNPIGEPAGVMFRRDDFVAVGGFDTEAAVPADLDLWLRLLRVGDFHGTPEALAAFRASSGTPSTRATSSRYATQRRLTALIGRDPHRRLGRTSRRALDTDLSWLG